MRIYAKSSKILLKDHSKRVSELSIKLYNHFTNIIDQNDIEILTLSSLLHDIGKSSKQFQNKILKNEEIFESESKKIPYLHNQVGSSYVYNHLDVTEYNKYIICNIIYWHHGVTKQDDGLSYDSIYDKLNSEDLERLKFSFNDIIENNNIYKEECSSVPRIVDKFFPDSGKSIHNLIYLRSIVITSDRLVSEYEDRQIFDTNLIFDEYVNSLKKENNDILFNIPIQYDVDRFNKQKEIVENCNRTTIVKAPAGFGKTNIGLLWGYKDCGKLLWVCPRNSVAESVYESIINEIESYGLSQNISVQLYLTGEVKKFNRIDKEFESDIIITNIDNYLKSTIDNGKLEQNLLINTCNVVFDEFHELIQETPIFHLFIETMKIRNQLTKSKTLLLSATPNNISDFWDSINNKTTLLPNKTQHYKSYHDKRYSVYIDKLINDDNTLVISNSISLSQDIYSNFTNNKKLLVHSMFTDDRKKDIIQVLYNEFGKKNKGDNNKGIVSSAPIIQASFDISFKNLSESVSTADNTLQRIGRCNRWGEYDDSKISFINNYDEKSEKMSILYNQELFKLWFNELSKIKDFNLDEIYEVYNNFLNNNKIKINIFNESILEKSKKDSKKIYPIKILNKKIKDKNTHSINGNKLRSNNRDGMFIIIKDNYKNWVGPFSDTNLFPDKYNIEPNKVIKIIENDLINDPRFSYSEMNNKHKKRIGTDTIKKWAQRSDKPLPVIDRTYDDEYGIRKK